MALAEVAKLIAQLDLGGNFVKNLGAANRALGKFDTKIDHSQSKAFQAGQHIGIGIKSGAVLAAAGVGFLTTEIGFGLRSLVELEEQQAQTNAVIKSTKGAAGISAQAVTDLSEKYESLNALMGDEVIRSGENMLLTFTNITGKAFEPALKAVLDMNTALGKGPEGLQSTAIQVGKALNNPTKGLTALQRVGVTFDKGQVKRIKQLQKEGKTYEAQKIILAELQKEFGGSFIGQGGTTAGKVAKFTDAIEDLQRALATALLPAVSNIADALNELLRDPEVIKATERLGQDIGKLFSKENIAKGIDALKEGFAFVKSIAGPIATVITTAVNAFRSLDPTIQKLLAGGFVVNKLTGGLVTDLITGVAKQALSAIGLMKVNAAVVQVSGPVAGLPIPGGGGTPEPIPGWNPNAGGTGGLINVLKNLPIIGLGIGGAELANLIGSSVAENLKELFPKEGQGDVVGDVIKSTVGAFTGALGIPNLISGMSGLVGTIQDIIPLIGAIPPQINELVNLERPGDFGTSHPGKDIDDVALAKALQTAVDDRASSADISGLSGKVADDLAAVGRSTDSVQQAVKDADQQISSSGQLVQGAAALAGYHAAAASTAAGAAVVNALSNLAPPIVQLFVSATSVEHTTTVVDRYGPTGGSRNDNLGGNTGAR